VKRGTLGVAQSLFGASTTTSLGFNASNQLVLTLNGTAAVTTTAVYRDTSAWYHIVYTQNGAAQTIYVNGVSAGTGTTSNTVFNTAIVHQLGASNTTNYFDGYLTEVNFIDGQALTPSAFGAVNVSTGVWSPLVYTGTYGINGFYLKFTLNPSITYGAFVVPNQYITSSSNAVLGMGSGDFTAEAWINPSNWVNYSVIFGTRNIANSTVAWSLGIDATGAVFFYTNGFSPITGAAAIPIGKWSHVAAVRSSGTVNIYINGSLAASAAIGSNFTDQVFSIGGPVGGGSQFFTGGISNLRIVKGTAVYTANFTPPTSQLTSITNTSLLTLQNATIVDNSPNGITFSNPTGIVTTSSIAFDATTNLNYWTLNGTNIDTAGITYDSMLDVPAFYADGGNGRGNYCTLNPLWQGRTNSPTNGNLDYPASSIGIGTMDVSQFSSYWEITSTGGTTTASVYSTVAATSIGVTTGLTYGFRFNAATGALDYTTNGSSFTSLATGLTTGPYFVYVSTAAATTASFNFGQRPFVYTPPTGFLALNTQNLPAVTIARPDSVMAATTYTGNGTSLTISNTNNNVSFQPDFVWIKGRSTTSDHALYDSVRGATFDLASNTTAAETTQSTGVTAFVAAGFTIGALAKVNTSAATYVAWHWKRNIASGLDIVTGTAPVSGVFTVNHVLGAVPAMIILKDRSVIGNWYVYHKAVGAPQANYLQLNTTVAATSSTTVWNNAAPTTTSFQSQVLASVASLSNYVAYCFAEVAGFSKFGSYTGNGLADGSFVYCGFRPRFILIKRTDSASAGGWIIWDTSRLTANVLSTNYQLYPNLANAESNAFTDPDILSNGFKARSTFADYNASGGTYIFAAFAEVPFKYALAR
jgi:hypothetical protein